MQSCACALETRAHLGEMVEAGGLLGEGQGVGAPLVVDGDEALLYVDVGGPILAHGAQLDQVALRGQLLQCVSSSSRVQPIERLQVSSCSRSPALGAQLLQRGIEFKESAHVTSSIKNPTKHQEACSRKTAKHSAGSKPLLDNCLTTAGQQATSLAVLKVWMLKREPWGHTR